MSKGFWPNFDQINISHRQPCSVWIVSLLSWQNAPEGGYDEKSWEKAYNWLMMTSSGDDNRPSRSLGLLTDKTKKKQEPQCGWNRAIKNTATHTVRLRATRNTKNQSGYEPLNLENGSFVNSDNFDATDWNCWEIVQNPTVREYTSRCNSVENIHIHKVIGPWDRVIFVGETEAIVREVPLVRSPKEVIVLIFIFL